MKSKLELEFSDQILPLINQAKTNGVDVKNVLESIISKMGGESTLPRNPSEYLGKRILYNISYERELKEGTILQITKNGFLDIEEIKDTGNNQITTKRKFYDPATVYIKDVVEDNLKLKSNKENINNQIEELMSLRETLISKMKSTPING